MSTVLLLQWNMTESIRVWPKVVGLAMKTNRWYKKLKGYNQIVEHMIVDVF